MRRGVIAGLLSIIMLGSPAIPASGQDLPMLREERHTIVRLPLAALADLAEVRRAVAIALAEDGRNCGDVHLALRWDPAEPGEIEAFGSCLAEGGR